jgi:hypothetical protein
MNIAIITPFDKLRVTVYLFTVSIHACAISAAPGMPG